MDEMKGLEKIVIDVMINKQDEEPNKIEQFETTSKNQIKAIADRSN